MGLQCLTRRKDLHQMILGNEHIFSKTNINFWSQCPFWNDVTSTMYLELLKPTTKSNCYQQNYRYCALNSLDPALVQNKIVVCESFDGPDSAKLSGASGVVVEGDFGYEDTAFSFSLPTTYLSSKDGDAILSYINSTK
ncbi:putative cucumisin [Helianthus debilis subsp. tardiflorus]